jgi:hypothetical protein
MTTRPQGTRGLRERMTTMAAETGWIRTRSWGMHADRRDEGLVAGNHADHDTATWRSPPPSSRRVGTALKPCCRA